MRTVWKEESVTPDRDWGRERSSTSAQPRVIIIVLFLKLGDINCPVFIIQSKTEPKHLDW